MSRNRNKTLLVTGFGESAETSFEDPWKGCVRLHDFSVGQTNLAEEWEKSLSLVAAEFAQAIQNRTQWRLQFAALNARIQCLEKALAEVRTRAAITILIQSLAPEPFDLVQPMMIVVQQSEDDFIATFFDANINASGETQEEAVTNLKDLLVGMFEALENMPEKLGPGPKRQLAVLKQFLKRSAECASSPKNTP